MAKPDSVFMFIAAVHGPGSKSFEEVRIDDYLKAYSATGRPPQHLLANRQEKASGVPLVYLRFFNRTLKAPVVNPQELPAAQVFHSTQYQGETMQSMACMSGFTGFSHEELRYHAYLRGHKFPPAQVPMDPFIPTQFPKANTSTSTPTLTPLPSVSGADPGDQLQNISTQPGFTGHCPEELRVMFLLSGRELTSAEIVQAQQGHLPPPAPTVPTASTSTLPPPPVTPSAQRPSIFGLGGGAGPTTGSGGLFGTLQQREVHLRQRLQLQHQQTCLLHGLLLPHRVDFSGFRLASIFLHAYRRVPLVQ
ncbi:hypothetical protein BDQ17DRAFT_1424291 [Cyathus striatus]|nr:hypothetical protein BDQ17DRAFT_1424291 [Cyathus striatus]